MSRKPARAQPGDRARLEILFDKPQLLTRLFGEYDQNLVAIENRLGVYIAARGNRLQIEGEAEQAARARDVLTGEALVAARAEEQAREAALVAKDSANEGAGKAGGITKAAGSMKPADTDGAIDARAGEAIEDAPSESAGSE